MICLKAIKRFEAKYVPDPNSGCWLWTAADTTDGYGVFSYQGKLIMAHRFSYLVHKGSLVEGMYVIHSCDVPCCVNPNHLRLGTPLENTIDKINKGRAKWSSLVGEACHSAKLKEQDVLHIRELYSCGITQAELSRNFNVSTANIAKIIHRRSWSWL